MEGTKQNAHSSEIVRCHFSFDGKRVVTVSSECHKVGMSHVSTICDQICEKVFYTCIQLSNFKAMLLSLCLTYSFAIW